MSKLSPPNLAGRVYLDFLVAEEFPEQEPAYQCAEWYDLLWFLIPIVGLILFIEIINSRWKDRNKS